MKLAKLFLAVYLLAGGLPAAPPARAGAPLARTRTESATAVPAPVAMAPQSFPARVVTWEEMLESARETAAAGLNPIDPREVEPVELAGVTPIATKGTLREFSPTDTAGLVPGTLARRGLRFPAANSTLSLSNPPDTMGAIGPRHFMEVINGSVGVYDRTTGLRMQRVSLPSFFSVVSGFKFDPRVLFDAPSGRWIASAARSPGNTPEPFGICLGVSHTDDPLGDWYQVFFYDPQLADTLHDFPMLGVGPNGIYVGALVTDTESSKNLWAFEKSPLLAALPRLGAVTLWRFSGSEPLPVPVQSVGPLGVDLVTSVDPRAGAISVYFVEGPPNQPVLRFQGAAQAPPAELNARPASAPGVYQNIGIDIGPYLGTVPVYRNRTIWAALRIQANQRNAVHWTRINPYVTPPRAIESVTVGHPSWDLTHPSIAVNAVGDTVMAFNASDTGTFVGAYYTGRRSSDPPGAFAPITLLKAGEAAYATLPNFSHRWGDYSNTSIDPLDDLTFWTIQQYAGFRGQTNTWGLWVSALSYGVTDCNGNQREDACDIDCAAGGCSAVCGTSEDCQLNGVPDECEIPRDCNNNGEFDSCEVAFGLVEDCNQNGRPDECDPSSDCNENSIPDECEPDCNVNAIPDDCDLASGMSEDCNENSVPDECERRPNFLTDSDPKPGRTLGRSFANSVRLTLQCPIATPPRLGRDITVAELIDGGAFGNDLSGGFDVLLENDRSVRLVDRLGRLEPGHWYAVTNPGWDDVQPFNIQFPVLVGDVDGNGWVLSSDFARVNAVTPTLPADPFDPRDVNADGAILSSDSAIIVPRIPSRAAARPLGH